MINHYLKNHFQGFMECTPQPQDHDLFFYKASRKIFFLNAVAFSKKHFVFRFVKNRVVEHSFAVGIARVTFCQTYRKPPSFFLER